MNQRREFVAFSKKATAMVTVTFCGTGRQPIDTCHYHTFCAWHHIHGSLEIDGKKLMLHEIATYLHDHTSTIKRNPAVFGGVVLLTAVVTFKASTWYYQQRVEYLKEHIDYLLRVSKKDINQIPNKTPNFASDDSSQLKTYDTILLSATTSQENDETYLVERPVYFFYDKIPLEVYLTISGEDISDVWVEDFSNNQTINTNTVHKSRDEVKVSIRHPTNIYSIYVRTASPSSIEYEFDFNIN